PCVKSETVSLSGQRVALTRRFSSARSASGKWTWNGRMLLSAVSPFRSDGYVMGAPEGPAPREVLVSLEADMVCAELKGGWSARMPNAPAVEAVRKRVNVTVRLLRERARVRARPIGFGDVPNRYSVQTRESLGPKSELAH